MKKLFLFILGIVAFSSTSFAQITQADVPSAEDFISPAPTGANMTVGFLSSVFDPYVGGEIAAFTDLGDGTPSCVGTYTITPGFMGSAIWGDDTTTPDTKEGLSNGEVPNFFILFDGDVYYVDELPEFTGYATNGLFTINGGTVTLIDESFFEGCTDDNYLEYNPDVSVSNQDLCITLKVPGCTDPLALNFSPLANFDDGSCVDRVYGCTDATAFNYDESANTDDGTCVAVVFGCIDESAFNYDESANTDDGTCIPVVEGCMDESACNYHSGANTATNDVCSFATGCESCSGEVDGSGVVIDNDADDDGYCNLGSGIAPEEVYGCTNLDSDNYSASNTEDDGSCYREGCMDAWAENYDVLATQDTDDVCYLFGCTDQNADNYDLNATDDNASCFREGCMIDYMDNYDPLATRDTDANTNPCYRVGCTDGAYFEYDSLATQDNFGDQCITLIVDGCYNPIAENYDPAANNGDQEALCIVNQVDPSIVTVTSNNMSVLFPASNVSIFDESSDLAAGDIVFAVYETSRLEADAIGYSAVNAIASAGSAVWTGETVGIAVFGSDGLENNGYYEAEPLVWLIAHDGVIYNAEVTYNDVNTSNSVGQYSEGGYISVSSIFKGSPFYEGCMDPTYYNFNPLATSDDGSCESMISFGCADTTYVNYAGCDLDTTNIDVNANNYGNAYVENVVFNINTELFEGPSGVCAEYNAQELCQDEVEGCTDPMALNYNPKATVNKKTICNWSFTPDGNDPTLAAYEVDSDGNITQVNYEFGGVEPDNVDNGFVNSDFHFAEQFTAEGPSQVFSPTDHVVDALAAVLEWIEDDETHDSLIYKTSIDSAAFAFAEDEAADEALLAQTIADADALLAFTLDSAAVAFAEDEAADEALLTHTLDSAAFAHEEYSQMRDIEFVDMFNYMSDSITMTLDSAAMAFAVDEAADEALLANTLDSAAVAFALDEAADEALLAQTIADYEDLLAFTLDSAAVAFALDEAADEELQQLTLDSLDYHRKAIFIDLKDGWNTIGYYLRHSSYATHQFESQFPGPGGVEAAINIVKDNVGNFWWPDFQFDGLGELIPGQGYQVRVKDGGAKSDFIFDHSINREDTEYRNLDPTVPQWAIDMPVDVHPNDVRTLIRVVNMLGQEVVPQDQFKGEVLLYLYNDGTVEKKIVQ